MSESCRIAVLTVVVAFSFVARTGWGEDAASAKGNEYFEKHVRPLLVSQCYSCHSSKENKLEGGLALDHRAAWEKGGENGPAIIPGDVEKSLLIQSVRPEFEDLQMPPEKPLTAEQIKILENWVRLGAPDPREKVTPSSDPEVDPSDPIAGRQHWAFQPLLDGTPAEDPGQTWSAQPIDRFIYSELQTKNLQPNRRADRRTLARRTYFQLIGMPPTEEQLQAFLNDEREDAYERLVDELLDSPHFGERWGRHWLDLARYADSNGLDENFLFREAWRYRNWVIGAVNADMPFDQFLLQQIAGDLLPYDSIEQRDQQRIAAGFLVIGPKVLLGNDNNQRKMDIADEQLDTIGRTVLGQTIGCARCHDHKFDPIPTADYYSLAGIMTSTNVMETRYMLGQQRMMERLVGIGEETNATDDAYEKYWRERGKLQERKKRIQSALDLLNSGDENALRELTVKHADDVAPLAADETLPIAIRVEAQTERIAQIDAALKPPEIPPRAMIPQDVDQPGDEKIRIAGVFNQYGDVVPRGFLQVVGESNYQIPADQSGRIQLAHWLTDVNEGAGHLAARVMANRVWYHLIGRGLVRTVDNFGRTGESPSHPELLDHLAQQLIDDNWSIKSLIRKIVHSQTFQLSSEHNDQAHDVDPNNVFLWRAHRRRLSPESLRDALLLAAGKLDLKPMDSTVWYLGDQATAVGDNKNRRRTDFPCRSVYLPVIRNDLPELFDVFDFANPHTTTGMRPETMVATQGLYLLNANEVMEAADATAARLIATEADQNLRVSSMFEFILGEPATDEEIDTLLSFIEQSREQLSTLEAAKADAEKMTPDKIEARAWSLACHALFASSRFQILE